MSIFLLNILKYHNNLRSNFNTDAVERKNDPYFLILVLKSAYGNNCLS